MKLTEKEILEVITLYANLQAKDAGQDGIEDTIGNKSYLKHKAKDISNTLKNRNETRRN